MDEICKVLAGDYFFFWDSFICNILDGVKANSQKFRFFFTVQKWISNPPDLNTSKIKYAHAYLFVTWAVPNWIHDHALMLDRSNFCHFHHFYINSDGHSGLLFDDENCLWGGFQTFYPRTPATLFIGFVYHTATTFWRPMGMMLQKWYFTDMRGTYDKRPPQFTWNFKENQCLTWGEIQLNSERIKSMKIIWEKIPENQRKSK